MADAVMTPEQTLARAERAKQLLDNALLRETLDALREECLARIESLPLGKSADIAGEYHALCHRLVAIRDLRRRLEAYVRHRAVAQAILDQPKR
jgi:hypothetical protein